MRVREDPVARRNRILKFRQDELKRWIKEANDVRTKYLPYAISLIVLGLLLLTFRVTTSILSSEISSGNIKNNSLIGPIEVNQKGLFKLSVQHPLNSFKNNLCTISMLLLDENGNYLTGATRDIYYERDSYGTYSESNAEYSIVINKEGTYYFAIVPKYSRKLQQGSIHYSLNNVFSGSILITTIGIVFIAIGGLMILFFYSTRTITKYIPPINSVYSIKIFKRCTLVGAIILISFFYSGLTFKGYAGSSSIYDAPSSMFSNNKTIYFGR
jgi:hypothetical protein